MLQRLRNGDRSVEPVLSKFIYPVLKSLAQRELGGKVNGKLTVRATELAHEAYLRLAGQRNAFESRDHFLALAGRVTRRVLVDLLRRRRSEKRGALVEVVPMTSVHDDALPIADGTELLSLDQAMNSLEAHDPIAAKIVELRYFAGLTNEEIAEVLDIGVATVVRRWQFGRAWLHQASELPPSVA
jgi:RNA polymerase sigma factor (TIGR02999 family)